VINQQSTRQGLRAPTIAAMAFAAIATTTALWPVASSAAPAYMYSDITVDLWGGSAFLASTQTYLPTRVLPLGDPARAEMFIPAPEAQWNGFTYGTPTARNDIAYASVMMNGSGYGVAGVSGWLDSSYEQPDAVLRANSSARWSVTNTGTAGPLELTFFIPLIEIAMRGNRYEYDPAMVEAEIIAIRSNSNGQFIERRTLFDYALDYYYEKPDETYAIQRFTATPDLLRDSGGLLDLAASDCLGCVGARVLPFSTTRVIDEFNAGDTIEFWYFFGVEVYAGMEGGGHALYGDPFGIGGGGNQRFFEMRALDLPAAAVPEPASWALMVIGLAGLAWQRRSGHAKPALRSDPNAPCCSG